ncbi:hypothetical protein GCM10027396_36900 [Insolitispirillum peregrinum]
MVSFSCPFSQTVPLDGSRSAMVRNRRDFPHPDGPMMATVVPASTSNEAPSGCNGDCTNGARASSFSNGGIDKTYPVHFSGYLPESILSRLLNSREAWFIFNPVLTIGGRKDREDKQN